MCVREWWETLETTPRKLRTLEIVLKDVENNQNWCFFLFFFVVFHVIFLVHWHIFDIFWMLQLFSFFCFWIKSVPFYGQQWTTKGVEIACWEVCHHVVGDYNFLTQKKKIFLKIISSPPTLCSVSWIQQCTYGYVQYTYDNFNIKKNFVFWSLQPIMTTC